MYTANDVPSGTYGKGLLCLENDDGSFKMRNDVICVQTLTKNLIFVGSLEVKGFEVKIKDEELKIIILLVKCNYCSIIKRCCYGWWRGRCK